MGIHPEISMLHAPALDSDIEASLSQGKIAIVSVGSAFQYQKLKSVLSPNVPVHILARVTVPYQYHSKFGMSLDEFKMLWNSNHRRAFSGIHIHLGEKLYYKESVLGVAEVAAKALDLVFNDMDKPILNLGGGWRSQTYEDWFNVRGIDNIRLLVDRICTLTRRHIDDFLLHFEFGHRIIEDAVVALCHVLETRKSDHSWIHILDGGACMLPLLKSAAYGVSSIPLAGNLPRVVGELAGPACYEADRFEGTELDLAPGDVVVFSNAGAYTLPLASGFGGFFPSIKAIFRQHDRHKFKDFDLLDWSLW